MTEKGVTFIYQPYEISYYAAGKTESTMPYDGGEALSESVGNRTVSAIKHSL